MIPTIRLCAHMCDVCARVILSHNILLMLRVVFVHLTAQCNDSEICKTKKKKNTARRLLIVFILGKHIQHIYLTMCILCKCIIWYLIRKGVRAYANQLLLSKCYQQKHLYFTTRLVNNIVCAKIFIFTHRWGKCQSNKFFYINQSTRIIYLLAITIAIRQ